MFRVLISYPEEYTRESLTVPLGPYETLEEFFDEYLNDQAFPQDKELFIDNTKSMFKEALRTGKWVDILPETEYIFRFVRT